MKQLFLKKLRNYVRLRAQGELSVGAGVAMERTIGEIKSPADGIPIEDLEIAKWLKKPTGNTSSIAHRIHIKILIDKALKEYN